MHKHTDHPIAQLHDAAAEIVRRMRQAMKEAGSTVRPERHRVYLPVLMQGTDMRVTIEAGPDIAASNATQDAQMKAGAVPAMDFMAATRRAADLLLRDARAIHAFHTLNGEWIADDAAVKKKHDETPRVADALARGRGA